MGGWDDGANAGGQWGSAGGAVTSEWDSGQANGNDAGGFGDGGGFSSGGFVAEAFPAGDSGSGDRPQREGPRPPSVNFKKLGEMKMSSDKPMIKRMTQKIQIFYKKDSNSVNEFWMQFPSEYLALFSQRYKSAIWDDHQKAITIVGGDKVLYKQIFDWINASADQESAADVPQFDESTKQVFKSYASLILCAEDLQIPARDFADTIIKKTLFKLSREKLMDWDEVDYYLDNFQGDSETDEKMREVLTNSVANGWWKDHFRENQDDEDDDDYCILSNLRHEHSLFDEDLHKWCAKNEERIRGKWAEKDAAKNAANTGDDPFGDAAFGDAGFGDNAGGALGGNAWDSAAGNAATGEWASGGDGWASNESGHAGGAKATGGWDVEPGKENMPPPEEDLSGMDTSAMPSAAALSDDGGMDGGWDDGGAGGNWAEEVIQEKQYSGTKW